MDRVAPDKFMLKRITQKYSDAEIDAFIAAKKHVTNNTGATKDSFGKSVGRETTFSGNKFSRVLPVKSVPKGTLLFTYYAASIPPEDYSPGQKAKHSFSELIGNSVMPCTYNKETDTFTLTYCKYNFMGNYYYPVPCAGFGILTYDTNTATACVTSRDADVAYLKTGGAHQETPTKMNMATSTNYEWVDFDFKRVQRCDHIETTGKCNDGNNFDICLNPEFLRDKRLAGYQAIAYPDRICEINQGKEGDDDVFLMDRNLMGRRYQAWLENVVSHGNQEADIFLHNMNLLCLETDITYAFDKTFVAFPEYFLYTFGENDPVELMNSLPDDPIIVGKNVVETEGEQIVKLEVTITAENIQQFLDTYIFPHTITRPFNMFNSNGSGLADSLPVLLAEKPALLKRNNNLPNNFVKNRGQQRNEYEYLVNHNIAEVIFNMRSTLVYDLTKNLILVIDEAASDRAKHMLNGRISANGRQEFANGSREIITYPIGFYDIPLIDNNAAERALKIKAHHEMLSYISKDVYDKCFMCEYQMTDTVTSEVYNIPIGPFFNIFTKGFSNPIALCNPNTINFMNSILYAPGATMDEALERAAIKIDANLMSRFFVKFVIFQKIIQYICSVSGLNPSQFLTEMTGTNMLRYSAVPVYIQAQGPHSKYFIVKYQTPQPNSNIPKMNIFYNSPLYNGRWRWSYADLLFTDDVTIRRVGLPITELPNVGLPVGLQISPSTLPNSARPIGISSQAFINQLLRGTNKGGSRTRRIKMTNMRKINIRNIRKNTRKNNRRIKMNSLISNNEELDTLVKPTVVTSSQNPKDVMYLQAIKPGAVIAHNAMVKMGLLNNFFIKFSGRPLTYKTAN
jgi:hypothetical protein